MSRVPAGFHNVNAHVCIKNAAAAIAFYVKAFGAEEVYRLEGPGGVLAHADLRIGDSTLWLADENPEWGLRSAKSLGGSPVTVVLYVDEVDTVVERAVKAGAKVAMPAMDMFWGDRFARIEDPFGQVWSIATRKKNLTPAEITAAFRAMAGK